MDFHIPVLSTETIDLLNVQPDKIYVDGTLGHGGHTLEILKKGGLVYGIDQDPQNLEIATNRIKEAGFKNHFFPVHNNFNELENIVTNQIKQKIDGLIIDLGLSQNQQTGQGRGFSFNDESSLDMRLDPENQELTAEEIINTYDYDELFEIFSKYAQEIYSKPIVLRIISERQKSPIKTATRLANIIRDFYKDRHIRSKIDPSTKIFMALRIIVNDEFENLKKLLIQSLNVVKKDGKVCIITFHSGEDRIVKLFLNQNPLCQAEKSVKASFEEIKKNPLSRSATLRSYRIV
ncbi:MAG: 16S rRNA (cytosine(1402)-N(4))-methyltransferase RsmH [Candidatus Shapirobacteria bacterium]|nr:16S rRNA (cytosine(1402)-N(4))-methyltransferase RsmH [Candidatus Shapirobacteria bacterium]MDD4410475.1 16S rRNA (cytosine(1402)-N(4))-methyltransferase RsmH [Candidatus Shapirobacteria bacterium]